jgi:hypothetical protein
LDNVDELLVLGDDAAVHTDEIIEAFEQAFKVVDNATPIVRVTKEGRRYVSYPDEVLEAVKTVIGEKRLHHLERHHVFFRSLGGSDESSNLLTIAAYIHRGKELGLHAHILRSMGEYGSTYDDLRQAWEIAKLSRRTRKQFLDKMRSAYFEFFEGSKDIDEIMEVIDLALDIQR